MKKEIWFGLIILALVVIGVAVLMPPPSQMTNGHLGLLMLALIVVAIMLGFPTTFTLMGMGMMFAWLAFRSRKPDLASIWFCISSFLSRVLLRWSGPAMYTPAIAGQ